MFLFTLVLGVLILPEADNLKCYECLSDLSGDCTNKTTECPSPNHQCVAGRTITFLDGIKISDVNNKGCGTCETFLEYSINFGFYRSAQNSTCCSTELCNEKTADNKSIPNGKKCFSCEGQSCTSTLNCEGDENHCIKATKGETQKFKGCASEFMCSDQITSLIKQFNGLQVSCCQDNYCNSASNARPVLLLLLVPLFFSLFSF